MSYRKLWQVNAPPGSPLAQAALNQVRAWCEASVATPLGQAGGDLAVFFYFEGVRHAADDQPAGQGWADLAREYGLTLSLCRSAWQRRYPELPRSEFRLGSLTDLVLWLEQAESYHCFGGAV